MGDYVNDEFYYYWNVYTSCKHAGPPFLCGWADWPPWVVQLMRVFDGIMETEKTNADRKFLAAVHGCKVN